MSEQTYSQIVGAPIIKMDIVKCVDEIVNIEKYEDIKSVLFKYNDISILKEVFNKLFEFQSEYISNNLKTEFGKYICSQIKKKYNVHYNYECNFKTKIFKISCKYEKTTMIFDYENNNIRLLSFNKNKFKSFSKDNSTVSKITEMTDGTTIYVIFDTINNKWIISTNHRLDALSNYDLPETHKDIFLKECYDKGYDFDKLLNVLVSNNKNTHVLMFSMRHYMTPIPLKTKDNTLKLISVYTVDNKIKERQLYNSKFNEYKNSNFSNDEIKEEIYSIINIISENIINYFDTKQFISFSEHIGFGKMIPFTEYTFNTEKDLQSQLTIFLRKTDNTFKGLMVHKDNYIECYENEEYNKIYNYRPKFSLNNQDNILIKLFMFQLELLYDKNKEIFFEYFKDLVELYDIKTIFENNKEKVYEFYEGILKWYKMVFIEKTKLEINIPPAYRYLKKFSFPKLLDMIINSLNKNFDIENEEDKQQLYRKLIIDKLLKDYHEQYKKREFCKYGTLFNNIFNPILEKQNDFRDL